MTKCKWTPDHHTLIVGLPVKTVQDFRIPFTVLNLFRRDNAPVHKASRGNTRLAEELGSCTEP